MSKQNKTERRWLTKGAFWAALIILILLSTFSMVLLALQLVEYVTVDDKELRLQTNMDTSLDLFSVSYKNASGDITVSGMDGQKVVAPGTSVEYTARLRNTEEFAIDYTLIPLIKSESAYIIPMVVRMIGPDGNYLIGNAKTWVSIAEMPAKESVDTLAPGESAEYIFQWKWAFESGDDEYDTHLGTSAVKNDINLKASFTVKAWESTQVVTGSGLFALPPGNLALSCLFLFLLLIAIMLLLYTLEKHKEAETSAQMKADKDEEEK